MLRDRLLTQADQSDWTLPAATTAFLGIGLIFGFWWWYFEGAAVTAHRHIRSRRDVRLFEIWNSDTCRCFGRFAIRN